MKTLFNPPLSSTFRPTCLAVRTVALMSWAMILAPGWATGQTIDTTNRPINVALGANTDTNGTLWSASWWTDILVDGFANVIHGDGAGGVTGFAEEPGFYYSIDLGQTLPLDGIALLPHKTAAARIDFAIFASVSCHQAGTRYGELTCFPMKRRPADLARASHSRRPTAPGRSKVALFK